MFDAIMWSLTHLQTSSPVSVTTLHHRSPAKSLPDTFLTTQKSAERSIMMKMKEAMKEFMMKLEPM